MSSDDVKNITHTSKEPHDYFPKGAMKPEKGDFKAHLKNAEDQKGSHKFLHMTFTAKQWKRFMNNLIKDVLSQIKKDEAKAKKALKKIKDATQ